MKKLFYVTSLLLITALSSFSTTAYHLSSSKLSPKKFSCAVPTTLGAQKDGTLITLTWSAGSSGTSFSYGGYYNDPAFVSFSGTTYTNTVIIYVPSSTVSITFRVVAT